MEQVPPFKQGLGVQRSVIVSQVGPSQPAAVEQSQVKLSMPSIQVPPWAQGVDAQSSMLISQLTPSQPASQTQS